MTFASQVAALRTDQVNEMETHKGDKMECAHYGNSNGRRHDFNQQVNNGKQKSGELLRQAHAYTPS